MKMKRLCSAVLSGALLLTACSAPAGSGSSGTGTSAAPAAETVPMGAFVEQDVTPADAADSGFVLLKGLDDTLTLMDVGADPALRWDSADGGDTWQKSELAWLDADARAQLGDITDMTLMEDGSLVVANRKAELYHVAADGTCTQIPVKELEGYAEPDERGEEAVHVGVNRLIGLSGGRFYLEYSGYVISEGNVYQSMEEPNGSGIYELDGTCVADLGPFFGAATANGSYLFRYNDSTLAVYDAVTGQQDNGKTGRVEGLQDLGANAVMMADNDGNVYFYSTSGVARYVPGGNLLEMLIDGVNYSFGMPSELLNGAVTRSGPQFFMQTQDSAGLAHLYRYTYDAQASQTQRTLRVWTLQDSDELRQVVSLFRKDNPDVQVRLEVALDGTAELGTQAEDTIRTLNTQMLAGEGPDVLILDGLPAQQFARSGMLSDLSPYVDPDLLYEPFATPFRQDNKVFMLPALFHMAVLTAHAGQADSLDSLETIAQAVQNGADMWDVTGGTGFGQPQEESRRPLLFFDDSADLFRVLWTTSAPAILANGHLDTDALDAFLNVYKTISDKYNLSAQDGSLYSIGFGTNQLFYEVPNSMHCYMMDSSFAALSIAQNLPVLAYPATFHGTQMAPDEDTAVRLAPGLSAGAWQPVLLAGVSAASGRQELAGRFVASLLGEVFQSTALPGGMPTTRAGMAAQLAAQDEAYAEYVQEGLLPEARGSYPVDVEALIARLGQPVLLPATVTDAVRQEARALGAGQSTVEEAAQAIESALQLYLAEQA